MIGEFISGFQTFAVAHIVAAGCLYVTFRAVAVIASPIPGALLDVPAVAVFGWPIALGLAEIGVMIGAMIAFGIARLFRERAVNRFITLRKVRDWEETLPGTDRFFAWVALRLPSNVAFDYVSYAAGLTSCPTGIFFWSTLLGNFPVMFGFFLLTGVGLRVDWWLAWTLPFAFLGIATAISARYLKTRRTEARQRDWE